MNMLSENKRITKFYECLLPTSICNLNCEYCYLIQEHRREMRIVPFKYNIDHMLECLRAERLAPEGGSIFFSFCGTGESLYQPELITLVHGLLRNGNVVNITTNGTLSEKIDEIINIEERYIRYLHISFSFHYIELERLSLLDVFFDNVMKVKNAGASIIVQLNLYDGYIPYLDDIKQICLERVGALPQIAVTRLETKGNDLNGVRIHTSRQICEYKRLGDDFESPLFNFTFRNFLVKRNEFCYAGDWTFSLHMEDGRLSPCYQCYRTQFIFEDPNDPIVFQAIGRNCKSTYCINSSHFMSLGVIPEVDCQSYCAIRNREEAGWYNDELKMLLSGKLSDSNKLYNEREMRNAEKMYKRGHVKYFIRKLNRGFRRVLLRLIRYGKEQHAE